MCHERISVVVVKACHCANALCVSGHVHFRPGSISRAAHIPINWMTK